MAVAAAGPNARAVDIDRIRREIDKQMARLFAELTRVQFAALFTIAESLAFLEELVGKESTT